MLTACPVPDKKKSVDMVAAFIRGAPGSAVGFVFYGVKASNHRDWLRAKGSGHPVWVIDNAYFDATRGKRFRVSRNRLQINARDHVSDCQRFDSLGLAIKPWRSAPDGHWLAVHQSEDHCFSAPDHKRWMLQELDALRHQRDVRHRRWSSDKPGLMLTLAQDLEHACGVLTHTSAAAVQAALAGVTCIVSEQHALHGMVCGHGDDAHLDQRRLFMGVLADNEFTTTEMENGTAWRHLNP